MFSLLFSLHELPPALISSAAAVVGAAVGSFCGVLVWRLPRILGWVEQNSGPTSLIVASHCSACAQPLRWWHNIPLGSYFLLRGQCAFCGARLPVWLVGIELFCAVWWAWSCWMFGVSVQALVWALWGSALAVISLITQHAHRVPDVIVRPLIGLGLLSSSVGLTGVSLHDAVWGAALGYLVFVSAAWACPALRGTEGSERDVAKLIASFGAWLGFQTVVPVGILACLLTIGAVAVKGRAR